MSFPVRNKFLLVISFVILFPFIILNAPNKFSRTADDEVRGIVLDISSYCKEIITWLTISVFESIGKYSINDIIRSELTILKKQKNYANHLKILLTESEKENLRLRNLLHFDHEFNHDNKLENSDISQAIGAFVIDRFGIVLTKQTIDINKGEMSGVYKGDVVISHAGAVGRVIIAGKNYSEVLILTDPSNSLNVLVQRSRMQGMLKGLKFFSFNQLDIDIKIGDLIVVSGSDSGFPEGVPIGTIINLKNNSQCACLEADVKPFVNFNRLEEVVVLKRKINSKHWSRHDFIEKY